MRDNPSFLSIFRSWPFNWQHLHVHQPYTLSHNGPYNTVWQIIKGGIIVTVLFFLICTCTLYCAACILNQCSHTCGCGVVEAQDSPLPMGQKQISSYRSSLSLVNWYESTQPPPAEELTCYFVHLVQARLFICTSFVHIHLKNHHPIHQPEPITLILLSHLILSLKKIISNVHVHSAVLARTPRRNQYIPVSGPGQQRRVAWRWARTL